MFFHDQHFFFQNEGTDAQLAEADALVFMVGMDDDAPQYSKSNALQVKGKRFRIQMK